MGSNRKCHSLSALLLSQTSRASIVKTKVKNAERTMEILSSVLEEAIVIEWSRTYLEWVTAAISAVRIVIIIITITKTIRVIIIMIATTIITVRITTII